MLQEKEYECWEEARDRSIVTQHETMLSGAGMRVCQRPAAFEVCKSGCHLIQGMTRMEAWATCSLDIGWTSDSRNLVMLFSDVL